jgi:hypothetical protein
MDQIWEMALIGLIEGGAVLEGLICRVVGLLACGVFLGHVVRLVEEEVTKGRKSLIGVNNIVLTLSHGLLLRVSLVSEQRHP